MARPSLWTITLGSNSNTLRTRATTYLKILMLPSKKTGGLPVALWQLHSVETGPLGRILEYPVCQTLSTSLSYTRRHNRNGTASGMFVQNSNIRYYMKICLKTSDKNLRACRKCYVQSNFVKVMFEADTLRLLSTTSKETSSDVIIQNSMSHNLPYEELETLLY